MSQVLDFAVCRAPRLQVGHVGVAALAKVLDCENWSLVSLELHAAGLAANGPGSDTSLAVAVAAIERNATRQLT